MENRDFLAGELLLIDKPKEWTSFDVVNKVRYSLIRKLQVKKLKVGHAGTLDPLATGLMLVCTGKKTKEIDSFMGLDKEYVATLQFGATTPSYDAETEIDAEYPTAHINENLLKNTLKEFEGQQMQMPPIFSAKKVNGKRAYMDARQGKIPDLKAVPIAIHEIELLELNGTSAKIRVLCSKGTYIRSLAYDIGKAIQSGAFLSDLVRTRIGTYSLTEAIELQKLIAQLQPVDTEKQPTV